MQNLGPSPAEPLWVRIWICQLTDPQVIHAHIKLWGAGLRISGSPFRWHIRITRGSSSTYWVEETLFTIFPGKGSFMSHWVGGGRDPKHTLELPRCPLSYQVAVQNGWALDQRQDGFHWQASLGSALPCSPTSPPSTLSPTCSARHPATGPPPISVLPTCWAHTSQDIPTWCVPSWRNFPRVPSLQEWLPVPLFLSHWPFWSSSRTQYSY